MNIHYIKQILVKQGKFPLYIAQYILNFIIVEEIKYWKTNYTNVLTELIKKPNISPIHSHNNLLSMLMHNTYYKIQKQQLTNSSIIEHKIVDEITTNIDHSQHRSCGFRPKDHPPEERWLKVF